MPLLAPLFRLFRRRLIVEAAREQADRAWPARWKVTPAMDMSVQENGSMWYRLSSLAGATSTSQYFVMDWQPGSAALLAAPGFDALPDRPPGDSQSNHGVDPGSG
jgi:hypothetical protein